MTSADIKAQAAACGFDLCGIAPAGAFPELRQFRAWLARGYDGEMGYLARSADRRDDVRHILPSARSVISLGTVYNVDRPYSTEGADPSTALIARYAWGDDYHEVVRTRMEQLVAWMREHAAEPFDARAYVDTGPVQERLYGQYAGLGWVGKNTCLINIERGSWFFLSEIICSLPLEPDAPAVDQCGSCTLCLDACPTGALVEPRVLDATQCLSYLTIELRGGMPVESRAEVGAHAYGCDICQEVCPWNHYPAQTADAPWLPRPTFDQPTLAGLWRRSDDDLRRALKGGAMTRAGVARLRRNLAVCAGSTRDPDALAALREVDQPSCADPMVAEHIAWALEQAQEPERG
ncbi:MAG TPA: tRNA epoxyqueuosine(34) reductase QueG [Vicinamibacterales bacterium]|nr:tRNA epoxyqueuosine(34) reductase QueG [Vicinamibacterales bacterium]